MKPIALKKKKFEKLLVETPNISLLCPTSSNLSKKGFYSISSEFRVDPVEHQQQGELIYIHVIHLLMV